MLKMGSDLEKALKRSYLLAKKELAILYTVMAVRDNSKSMSDFFRQLIAKLLRIFECQLAFGLEYFEKTDDFEVKATNAKGILKKNDYELIRRISKDCMERSVPIVINKTKPNSALSKLKIFNFLAVPVLSHSECVGSLILMNKRGGFTKTDLRFLVAISNQVYNGMVHMKLYDELEEVRTKEKELYSLLYEKEGKKSTIDEMTQTFNKRYFLDSMKNHITLSEKNLTPLSLIMFDVDYFGSYNNKFGHEAGDRVLKDIAKTAKKEVGANGEVCRYGGEEFAVILPNTDVDVAGKIAEKLRAKIENLYDTKRGDNRKVTCSFGVAQWEEEDTPDFVKKVDKFLYVSKEKGRNVVNVAKEQNSQ